MQEYERVEMMHEELARLQARTGTETEEPNAFPEVSEEANAREQADKQKIAFFREGSGGGNRGARPAR